MKFHRLTSGRYESEDHVWQIVRGPVRKRRKMHYWIVMNFRTGARRENVLSLSDAKLWAEELESEKAGS